MRKIKGMTEEEVVAVIYKVAKRLAYKYRFGYHGLEDIIQVAVEKALIKIETKYDDNQPLENFLSIVLRNELYNYRRDNFQRFDKPCLKCPLNAYIKKDDKCTAYSCKSECLPFSSWAARNESRKNIMMPIDISDVDDERENNMRVRSDIELLEFREIIEIVDKYIPIDFYKDWLKYKTQNKLSNKRTAELLTVVKDIIREHSDYE